MRTGILKTGIILTLLAAVSLIAGALMLSRSDSKPDAVGPVLTFTSFKGEFVNSVVEAGEVESSSNVEIRCQVKSRGSAGTAIIEIIPEGTQVKVGDFICQLDDSVLKEELTERKISVAQDEATVIQAESSLDTAERTLVEFENGIYEQERARLAAAQAFAEENLRRSLQYLKYSEKLNSKGYTTKTQLEADAFASQKAQLELELASQNLSVYENFTKERVLAEYRAEIDKQKANVKAATFTLELSTLKQSEIEQQIEACRIVAPFDGMVVYANENDRDDSFVIEEGAVIRHSQPIVFLPDPEKMQVRTRVNDSKINSITKGCDALVRVDTDPEQPVRAKVRMVNSFPEPRRWFQAPIEYQVFVDITEKSPLIRPGLRGKVEIFVERIPDVVQVPLSSIVFHGDRHYVLLRTAGEGIKAQRVEVGSNNDKFVVIANGIENGVDVIVDADNFTDEVEFPASPATEP